MHLYNFYLINVTCCSKISLCVISSSLQTQRRFKFRHIYLHGFTNSHPLYFHGSCFLSQMRLTKFSRSKIVFYKSSNDTIITVEQVGYSILLWAKDRNHFFPTNQWQATTKIYSWIRNSFKAKTSDWHILTGNNTRIVLDCLNRCYYGYAIKNFLLRLYENERELHWISPSLLPHALSAE